jgi:hypothetical protein
MTIHHKPTKCPVCGSHQEIVRLTATPTVRQHPGRDGGRCPGSGKATHFRGVSPNGENGSSGENPEDTCSK